MGRTNLRDNLGIEFERLTRAFFAKNLSEQFHLYERRVRGLVKELNLMGIDARNKSKTRLDKFTGQLKRTRTDLEKRFSKVLDQETTRLNRSYLDLLDYLKTLAKEEIPKAKKTKSKSSRKTTKRKSRKEILKADTTTTRTRRASSTRPPKAKKTVKAREGLSST